MSENNVLLEVSNLKMWFPITQGIVFQRHAIACFRFDGDSPGETHVPESTSCPASPNGSNPSVERSASSLQAR